MQDGDRKAVGIEKELPVVIPFDDISDLAGEGITSIEDYLGIEKISGKSMVFPTHCSGLTLRNSLGAFRHKQDSTLVAEQAAIFSTSGFLRVNI